MTQTEIDYEKVFQLFVDKGEGSRLEMTKPFRRQGSYFATDGYSLITMPTEKAELNFQPQDSPKAESVIPKDHNCNVEIKVADIERQLIPTMVDETITVETKNKCKNSDCEDGYVECDMGHEHECPKCYGAGEIVTETEKPTGKQIPMGHKLFRMLQVGFQYTQLRRLVDACNLMGVETITKVFGTDKNGNLFQCGDARILVMPAIISGEESDEFKPTDIIV